MSRLALDVPKLDFDATQSTQHVVQVVLHVVDGDGGRCTSLQTRHTIDPLQSDRISEVHPLDGVMMNDSGLVVDVFRNPEVDVAEDVDDEVGTLVLASFPSPRSCWE